VLFSILFATFKKKQRERRHKKEATGALKSSFMISVDEFLNNFIKNMDQIVIMM